MVERYRPKRPNRDVGYGRPPVHCRFQPGQTGNPKGRPKGSRNLKTELAAELAERIVITEGGRQKKVSKLQAIVKRLSTRALSGDVRASDMVFKLVERHLMLAEEPGAVQPLPSEDRAILERFLERNARREGWPAERDPEEDSDNAG